jgi:hypothetical protein
MVPRFAKGKPPSFRELVNSSSVKNGKMLERGKILDMSPKHRLIRLRRSELLPHLDQMVITQLKRIALLRRRGKLSVSAYDEAVKFFWEKYLNAHEGVVLSDRESLRANSFVDLFARQILEHPTFRNYYSISNEINSSVVERKKPVVNGLRALSSEKKSVFVRPTNEGLERAEKQALELTRKINSLRRNEIDRLANKAQIDNLEREKRKRMLYMHARLPIEEAYE